MKKSIANSNFKQLSKTEMIQLGGGRSIWDMVNDLWDATPYGGWSSWHNNGSGMFHGVTSSGQGGIYNSNTGQFSWLAMY